jgi:hypothetical protein
MICVVMEAAKGMPCRLLAGAAQLLSSPAAGASITSAQKSVISPIKYTDKKKFFLIYKKFRGDRVQSHI